MSKNIIGISAYYHDSAAALLIDGVIKGAAQEERFTRKKHDAAFPSHALTYLLKSNQLSLKDIDYVVFYDKPLVKFERLLETYLSYAPQGLRSFLMAMPIWLKEKLFLKETLKRELSKLAHIPKNDLPPLMFTEHHQAHAASAFFPSPFQEAAVLCVDGVGEWATTSVWHGKGNQLDPLWEINFPHSLGLLYSAFTYYTGFRVNSGEYKLMGLAPYGEPKYVDLIYQHLIDVKDDGSFRLNMQYFDFATGLTMTNKKFAKLFAGPPRQSESEISQKEMDIARSVQVVTEEIIIKIARYIKKERNIDNLCLAGGVALNCVSNGKLFQQKIFSNIWIQPAAGDAGGALGAALSIWYEYLEENRTTHNIDAMQGTYLGPKFSTKETVEYLGSVQAQYKVFDNDAELFHILAQYLASEQVVGWFQGRMEFGPRALGGRSIIGDPRSKTMQSTMNLKIKYRESFRPFAPSINVENVTEWFDYEGTSPYMLMVAKVKEEKQIKMDAQAQQLFGIDKLNITRSLIPAITHVDYSARIQTVHQETNPRYWQLIKQFNALSDCPILINTSFNVRGEPIVCTPADAYRCFMRTEMDYLVIDNVLLCKKDQPQPVENDDWKQAFELD